MHRTRRCRAGGPLLKPRALGLALLLLPAACASAPPVDWALVSLDLPAGAHGFSLRATIEGPTEAERLPRAAIVAIRGAMGGFGYDDHGAVVGHVATSGAVGAVRVTLAPPERRDEATVLAFGLWSPDDDATTVRTLFLAPGIEGERVVVEAHVEGHDGPFPVAVTTGRGAAAVTVPELASGWGLSTGTLSAGAGETTADVAEAVVGSLTFECALGPCESRWTRPDGRSGALSADGYVSSRSASGTEVFVGPPGAWSFAWDGVQHGETIALYAPVGELASLFP